MTHSRTCAFALLLILTAPAAAQNQPKVDLVIALDTSGSMRGLIDATRLQLWNAVRLLTRAQPQPVVRVGLISFGNKWHDPATGWVKRELDLTTDLDAVSARLFSLTARGANEYVARTVQTATRQMSWDQTPGTLKILFVAGNESAEQDPRVGLTQALAEARQRGILVNAIYCGRPEAGEARGWRVVASAGGGKFAAIDHNRAIAVRTTPYDAQLAALSRELSRTYVAFGKDGAELLARQREEDERALRDGPSAAAERAATKATSAYRNEHWDAVDALEKKGTVAEAPKAIKEMAERRHRVQAQIADLSARRDAYLDASTRYSAETLRLGGARSGKGADTSVLLGASVANPYGTTSGGGTWGQPAGGIGGAGTLGYGAGRGRTGGSPVAVAPAKPSLGSVRTADPANAAVVAGDTASLARADAPAAVAEPASAPPPPSPATRGGMIVTTAPVTARVSSAPAAPAPARYHFAPGTVTGTPAPEAPADSSMARRARPAAKPAAPKQTTMDDAFSGTLRRQAAENGYSF
jgi:hypothetical protein